MRRRIGLTVVLLTMVGCSADVRTALEAPTPPTDHAFEGETEIEIVMAVQFGVGVEAHCEEPVSTEPGSTFACTATTPAGRLVPFLAEITATNEVKVTLGAIPG